MLAGSLDCFIVMCGEFFAISLMMRALAVLPAAALSRHRLIVVMFFLPIA
jgi:hypothetical protein